MPAKITEKTLGNKSQSLPSFLHYYRHVRCLLLIMPGINDKANLLIASACYF